MKIYSNQQGFSVISVILAFLIISTVSGVGFYVYNSQNNKKSAADAVTQSYKPENFSECLKAGGEMQYINISQGSGYEQPDQDYSFNSTHCDYPKTPALFPEVDDPQCSDKQRCADIQQAVQEICNDLVPGKNLNPTFQYLPVVKGNFSRLYLSDCSAKQLKLDRIITIILTTTEGKWQIKHKFEKLNCTEIDKAQIPLDLFPDCWFPALYR